MALNFIKFRVQSFLNNVELMYRGGMPPSICPTPAANGGRVQHIDAPTAIFYTGECNRATAQNDGCEVVGSDGCTDACGVGSAVVQLTCETGTPTRTCEFYCCCKECEDGSEYIYMY